MVTETIIESHVKCNERKMGIPPFPKRVKRQETGRREWCWREVLEMPHVLLDNPDLTGYLVQSDWEELSFLRPISGYFPGGEEARFSNFDFHKTAQMC